MPSRHHHHNPSLRRAILAQTGMAAYPYMRYKPVSYSARYDAYSGAFGAEEGAADAAADAATKAGKNGDWSGKDTAAVVGTAAEVVGGFFTKWLVNRSNQAAVDAQLEAQKEIELAKIRADQESAEAASRFDALGSLGGMSTTTMFLGLGGLALVGTTAYLVFRKQKKKKK